MSGDPIVSAGVAELSRLLQAGEITAVEAVETYLGRIEALDAGINAYTHVDAPGAMRAAEASDERRAAGESLGPLDGIPLAVKDNIAVKGLPCTGGFEAYRNRVAQEDSAPAALLRAGGAIFLGMVNMPPGALGATTENEAYGNTHNPWRHGFTPGGSSGGSGAAVAAGLCAAALGTDTLGSVRIPSAYCGGVGLKPTQGLISIRGLVVLSYTLDSVGPMARRVADLWPLMRTLAVFDPQSPESREAPTPIGEPLASIKGLRLGRVVGLEEVGIDPAIVEACERAISDLKTAGATVIDVRLEPWNYGRKRRRALITCEAEASHALEADLKANPAVFQQSFRDMLAYGAGVPGATLAACYREIADALPIARALFAQVDALVLPTAPQTAFAFGQKVPDNQADLTTLANLARLPALSVPMGLHPNGLPMGIQFVGPEWADATLLSLGEAYEEIRGGVLDPYAD